jgi:hypothetical protein
MNEPTNKQHERHYQKSIIPTITTKNTYRAVLWCLSSESSSRSRSPKSSLCRYLHTTPAHRRRWELVRWSVYCVHCSCSETCVTTTPKIMMMTMKKRIKLVGGLYSRPISSLPVLYVISTTRSEGEGLCNRHIRTKWLSPKNKQTRNETSGVCTHPLVRGQTANGLFVVRQCRHRSPRS